MPTALQAAFGQRYCAINCLVRNLSCDRARLVFSDHVLIPDEFDLMIPLKGDSRHVRIVWRYQANAACSSWNTTIGDDPLKLPGKLGP